MPAERPFSVGYRAVAPEGPWIRRRRSWKWGSFWYCPKADVQYHSPVAHAECSYTPDESKTFSGLRSR
jgi:hypothetical protein